MLTWEESPWGAYNNGEGCITTKHDIKEPNLKPAVFWWVSSF